MGSALSTKGYSVWLVPSGDSRARLAKTISKLSKENRGPAFEPHITLIGKLMLEENEALRLTALLAKKIRPFGITLGRTDGTDFRFRCIFVRVFGTSELLVANSKSREIFKVKKAPRYTPHLSLFYGRLPQKTKEEIITGMRNSFSGTKLDIKRIRLMRTKGLPKHWRKIRDFRLR